VPASASAKQPKERYPKGSVSALLTERWAQRSAHVLWSRDRVACALGGLGPLGERARVERVLPWPVLFPPYTTPLRAQDPSRQYTAARPTTVYSRRAGLLC
jgi:hypothetical protein